MGHEVVELEATAGQDSQAGKWVQDTMHPTDKWAIGMPGIGHGYVAQYEHNTNYFWLARRNGHALSGIEETREAAMQRVEAHLACPIEDFNAQVAAELTKELREIERKLSEVSPAAIIPGYHTGYEDGYAACRRRIEEALQ